MSFLVLKAGKELLLPSAFSLLTVMVFCCCCYLTSCSLVCEDTCSTNYHRFLKIILSPELS